MSADRLVYIGTYTHPGRSEGIYIYRLDSATGALAHVHTVAGVADPAFLALAPDGQHLYSVNWLKQYEGRPGGSISAFAVDGATGDLAFLNRQPAGGADPCHLCVDPSGRCVVVANHESGTVAVLPI
ncbi:MAG TPA: beta-propeller fold lactonase family protein, partial [Chloroflexota bacterium]